MPRGFRGNAPFAYLTRVSDASNAATESSRNTPSHAPPGPRERRMPYPPHESFSGAVTTGQGNSSNIVSDFDEYNTICNEISQADDRISEYLHRVTAEIEDMCQTIFILPKAVPRCLNISLRVKNLLPDFREITDDATMEARRFAREISNIQ